MGWLNSLVESFKGARSGEARLAPTEPDASGGLLLGIPELPVETSEEDPSLLPPVGPAAGAEALLEGDELPDAARAGEEDLLAALGESLADYSALRGLAEQLEDVSTAELVALARDLRSAVNRGAR